MTLRDQNKKTGLALLDPASISDEEITYGAKGQPFECVALLLQGGGSLGAYQGGVYQALSEANLHPNWVSGISIGSINAAIIAGNAPQERVEKLKGFWQSVTANPAWDCQSIFWRRLAEDSEERKIYDQLSALDTMVNGVSGFFKLRIPPPIFVVNGSPGATSYYDTKPLIGTLKRFADFDRINNGDIRFSAGAVNVRTGNFVYFDSKTRTIRPEHVLASAALPPGLPAIEIDGEQYWDGGLVSNTPLEWVLQFGPRQDTLAFAVDLWSARGRYPRNMLEVATRAKEIRFSSRTRQNTDRFEDVQRLRHAIGNLIKKASPELADSAEIALLKEFADDKVYNIIHLIYRAKQYEGESKDFEFSRLSMKDHWKAGYNDTVRTLRHPEVLQRPANIDGIAIFDFGDRD